MRSGRMNVRHPTIKRHQSILENGGAIVSSRPSRSGETVLHRCLTAKQHRHIVVARSDRVDCEALCRGKVGPRRRRFVHTDKQGGWVRRDTCDGGCRKTDRPCGALRRNDMHRSGDAGHTFLKDVRRHARGWDRSGGRHYRHGKLHNLAGIIEGQAGQSVKDSGRITVTDVDQKVCFPSGVRHECSLYHGHIKS